MEHELCDVPEDHPINLIANTLADQAPAIIERMNITHSEFCIALVNACAQVLGECEDLTDEQGLEHINGLSEIMRTAYIMRNVQGHS